MRGEGERSKWELPGNGSSEEHPAEWFMSRTAAQSRQAQEGPLTLATQGCEEQCAGLGSSEMLQFCTFTKAPWKN